jgi:RNA 3'-phosphate cyclase
LIEIDGSYGEGGGSVLRIATALSALTSKPVHITNIRSGRPKPGLMAQHMNAVKSVADLSNASVKGLEIGSTEIYFNPKSLNGGFFKIDVGTAGSISLILQAFMIPAAFTDIPVKIRITGGTDVRWAPSVDFIKYVKLPILRLMGYNARINIIQRGHYPRGGGILEIEIDPITKLKPINVSKLQFDCIYGISHSIKLPIHIAERQAQSAKEILNNEGYCSDIKIESSQNAIGPGSSIFLWTNGLTPISGGAVGEPGKRAEKVGSEAAKQILYHISKRSPVDKYMGDQLIPYMALAGSSSIKTAELTQHTLTNIHITEKFIDKKFHVDGIVGESAIISVE